MRILFIFVNVCFDCVILLLISVSHLPSGVMIVPRYLNLLTCFKVVLLMLILHFGALFFLDITIVSVFFLFNDSPMISLLPTIYRDLKYE